jgi:hypothetical protein
MFTPTATQLTFTLSFRYQDDPGGITIPIILRYQGRTLDVWGNVDPGAAVCLFKRKLGELLAIPIESGAPVTLDTLGGPLAAFGHEVVLQTGDIVFESIVYFAKYHGLKRNLLGRQGWGRKILLGINDNDNMFYLNALSN